MAGRPWTQVAVARARAVGDRTPRDRDRVVDLVRVSALVLVVLGHWLKQGLYVDDAEVLRRDGVLGQAEWSHPLTWVFQVMPLVFAVGGFANALSWRHAVARGTTYGAWLRRRARRLTTPLLPLLLLWAAAPLVAPGLGLGDDWLHAASKTSLVATWFLAAYLLVVALVPLTHAAWRRWGWASIAAGLVLAALVDVLTLGAGLDVLGPLNVLLVWGTLHQGGYAWLDLRRRPGVVRSALACVLLLGLVLVLVRLGPYGVSMVGVDGFGANNTSPPRVTVLVLGGAQLAGVLVLEPWLARLVRRPLVWAAVVAVDVRAMTVYLWHLTVLALLAGGCVLLGGAGLRARPASAQWWLTRPAWLLVLLLATAVVVAVLGRLERRPLGRVRRTGASLPLLEVVVVSGSLAYLASYGVGSQSDGLGGPVAAACLATVLALSWWDRRPVRTAVVVEGRRR